jgi:hypothetical protein
MKYNNKYSKTVDAALMNRQHIRRPEYQKKYRVENREKIYEYNKKYRVKNRDKINEYYNALYHKHPERQREANKKWLAKGKNYLKYRYKISLWQKKNRDRCRLHRKKVK